MLQHVYMFYRINLLILFVCLLPQSAFANHRDPIHIESLDKTISFDLPIENEAGGVSIDVADLGTDAIPEIIVGNGLGNEPRIRVVRLDGSEVESFLAYLPDMGVGISVIACDLNGDGYREIVSAPQHGGGPHIRIFDRYGKAVDNGGFFAYNEAFRGGVNLACGDLDGNTGEELVTLPSSGGGSHVKVWSITSTTPKIEQEYFAFDASLSTGLVGVIHDRQLTVAQQHTDNAIMKTFDAAGIVIEEKMLHQKNILSLSIAKNNRYITTQAGDIFSVDEENIIHTSHDAIVAVTGSTSKNSDEQIISASSKRLFDQTATRMLVDLSEQRLYAYKDGVLENTFLISSGLYNSTPVGIHHILAKIMYVDYTWSYGPNDPRNYNLGLVPYNLRYEPHLYFHYAYWHTNFGHVMSHGCINVGLTEMKWLYAWANEGIEATIQP